MNDEEIKVAFQNISMKFFCKFELMKGIKKVANSEDIDQLEMEKDKRFLLVKTW